MKITNLIYLIALLLLVSCEDYLDRVPGNNAYLTEDEIFDEPERLFNYADRLYDCANSWTFEGRWNRRQGTDNMGDGKNYASVNQVSGEVISFRDLGTMTAAFAGNYWELCKTKAYASPDFSYSWQSCWEGIYIANHLISKFNDGDVTCLNEEEYNRTLGTAYAMRAYYYTELIQRWGAVPYFSERMTPETSFDVEQANYDTIVSHIVSDCDMGAALIPEVSYLNDDLHMGRIGKAAALAVKAKCLNTAASKLNNPTNDLKKWEAAANAAWDVIKMSQANPTKIGLYKVAKSDEDEYLNPTFYKGRYNNIFYGLEGTVEDLWPRYNKESGYGTYTILWPWVACGNSSSALGSSPTLEYVDLYETSTGYPIFHEKSTYTDDHPFSDRDPRFETNLLHHGSIFNTYVENDTLDMMTSPYLGEDRDKVLGASYGNSKTGYLVKKVLPQDFNPTFNAKSYINAPFIRMAEMYLIYAEAVNEAWGPKAKAPGATMDAVQSLNTIRTRVGHVNVPDEFTTDQTTFRARVRNEYKVELMFEYHTFFDLMRWKTAVDVLHNQDFSGMLLTLDDTKPEGIRYERYKFHKERKFYECQYRYPFFREDMDMAKNLKQNPGW